MKLTYIKHLFFLSILFSTLFITAQNSSNNKLINTKYLYSFSAEMDATSIHKIEQEVATLKNVTEVKVKYKDEKKSALLIVIVREAKRTRESDVLFQPINLKRIISKNGFAPKILKSETLTN